MEYVAWIVGAVLVCALVYGYGKRSEDDEFKEFEKDLHVRHLTKINGGDHEN